MMNGVRKMSSGVSGSKTAASQRYVRALKRLKDILADLPGLAVE